MNPYSEYKDTNLPWLPKIPKHWEWLMLFQLAAESCVKNTDLQESNVLSLSYGAIVRKRNLNSGLTPKDYASYQIVTPGNTILRLTDLQNDHRSLRTGLVKERGIITSAYTCLKAIQNPDFLRYVLHAYDLHKVFYGLGGGVRQSIGYSDIRSLRLPVPPLVEQMQIVRYLDGMTARISRLIRAKKREIGLLREQKQAIVNQAVTHGLDPNAEMKDSGIDWIGMVPKNWSVLPIKYCAEILPGFAFDSQKFATSGKYLLLRGINVGIEKINHDNVVFWNEKIEESAEAFLLEDDDIVLGLDRPWIKNGLRISKVTANDIPALLVQRVCRVRPKEIVKNDYLLIVIEAILGKALEAQTTGISVPHISTNQVENVKIPVPSLEEQQDICTQVQNRTFWINRAVEKIQNEICVIDELKNTLISQIITGAVDIRGLAVEDVLQEESCDVGGEEESGEEDALSDE